MYRKFILYLAGLCCALLLLSFSGCQSQAENPDTVSVTDTTTYSNSHSETLSEENPETPDSPTEFSVDIRLSRKA